MSSSNLTTKQLLYIDGSQGYRPSLADACLSILRNGKVARLIPVRQLDRVILRNPVDDSLQALLNLTRHDIGVHFQDGNGNIVAALVRTDRTPEPWIQTLAWRVQRSVKVEGYADWLDIQLRHAASRILRRNPQGPIASFEAALQRYLGQSAKAQKHFTQLQRQLTAQLHALTDHQLRRQCAEDLVNALNQRNHHLIDDLVRCLKIPAMWSLKPMLRQNPTLSLRDLVIHVESIQPVLSHRLQRHLLMLDANLIQPSRMSARALDCD